MEKNIKVGICDDEPKWCAAAGEILKKGGRRTGLEIEVYLYEGSGQLLEKNEPDLDVLFLDIEMKSENGIEIAAKVNEMWKDCQIVYLTNYLCYATDVYETEHAYFVLKEEFEERLEDVFQKILRKWKNRRKQCYFQAVGGTRLTLLPQDILYLERQKRKTVICSAQGNYEVWDKLDDIAEKLPQDDFVRCHNSYLVRFADVSEIQKDSLLLRNGIRIPVSRGRMKETRETFARWARQQMS